MNRKLSRIRFTNAELLLITGLLLLNVGCFLGKSETVDAWCRFVVHSLDVRYWTWKSDAAVLSVVAVLAGWSRIRHGTFRHCRGLILACVVLGIATMFHFGLDMMWNRTGKTYIVHQYPKGERPKGDYLPLDYKVHVPPGFWGLGGRRPLIVFLHGAGCVNMDVEDLTEDLVNCLTPEMKKDFPFVVISPASWRHGWKVPQILQILDEATVRWNIDPNRIYLTGNSMGGFGTFQIACDSPKTFAAIVPVCGGGDPSKAERLKTVPTWAFHGDADDVVPYECSEKMIDAMKEVGHNDARLTNMYGAGHGIASDVYRNPELYRWMLKHKKQQ
jgi:poly(3-hydroxybutyrate) depolymerase